MATRHSQYIAVLPEQKRFCATKRHRILVGSAKVSRDGNAPIQAELHDLSIYGCRIACEIPQKPDDKLWVRLAGFEQPIAATVAWNDGNYVGCRFVKPIDSKLLRMITLGIADPAELTSDS